MPIVLFVGRQQAVVSPGALQLFSYDPPHVAAITIFDDGSSSMLTWPEATLAGSAVSISGSSFGSAPAPGWAANATDTAPSGGRTIVMLGNSRCLIVRMTQSNIVCLARKNRDILVVTVDGRASDGIALDYSSLLNIPVLVSARVDGYAAMSGPTAGGVLMRITGANFKERGWLRFGSAACSNATISVLDSLMTCTLPEGHGANIPMTFVVGMIESNTLLWIYGAPRIASVVPGVLPPRSCDVVLFGTDFGAFSSTRSFVSVTDVGNNGAQSNCTVLEWTHVRIACQRASVDGSTVIFSVTSYGLVGNAFQVPLEPPVIEFVVPRVLPTVGGNVVNVRGRHFGSLPVAIIDKKVCSIIFSSDDNILCLSPEGQGRNLQLVVRSMGLQSNATTAHFHNPEVQDTIPSHGPAAGLWKLRIIGGQ